MRTMPTTDASHEPALEIRGLKFRYPDAAPGAWVIDVP